MKYNKALNIAEQIKSELSPLCKRIEIAGSIRRKKEEPRDIEIVAIPKANKYFDLKEYLYNVKRYSILKGNFPGRYMRLQRSGNGAFIDLFFCKKSTWWMIFLIRTGNADFSKFVVTRAKQIEYRVEDGKLYDENGIPFEIESEREVFDILMMRWRPPEQRNLTFCQYYEFTK